jgi:hypothetical protein
MKILAVGHSIIDHFVDDREDNLNPGGMFYTAAGLINISVPGDEIFLLTSIDNKYYYLFDKVYSKCNLSFSNWREQIPEVFLKTSGLSEREEIYKNISVQLDIPALNDWARFDGILINMITGFDISPEQLTKIRSCFNKTIYLDIHTLSRGVDSELKRTFRKIPHVEKWLENIDILQCNQNELATIFNGTEKEVCMRILECGPSIVIVTKGEDGAILYSRDLVFEVNPRKVEIQNSIGCGDIFGASFFYSYILNGDMKKALITANNVAAEVVSSKNFIANLFTNCDAR